jgi:hypothetical protein
MKEKLLTLHSACVVALALSGTMFMTGCCCNKYAGAFACAENLQKGLPIITCQPMDQQADSGQGATFYVKTEGKNLKYQWYYIGGGMSADPVAIPNATEKTYKIPAVAPLNHYGLYFCAVYREGPKGDDLVTQSRQASLGGRVIEGPGTTFPPVQNAVQQTSSSSVCNNPVGAKWVRFGTFTPSVGGNPPGTPPDVSFQGSLWKLVGGSEVGPISRGTYYLQWYHSGDAGDHPCCVDDLTTPLAEQKVDVCLIPGNSYTVTAYFVAGSAPTTGTTIILKGAWLTQCPPP